MAGVDVLIVSLGGTAGLREADAELAGALRRAGASAELAPVPRARELRTFAAIELAWAVNARRATARAVEACSPRAVIYSSTTAALLGPVPGAIRFDAPAAGNRPGRHGLWQRPVERRRFRDAPLLLPWSDGGLAEAPTPHADAVIVPMPVARSGEAGARDIAAVTYGANPEKKGLDRVLAAWARAARPDEELVVAGLDERAGAEWRARAAKLAAGGGAGGLAADGGAAHGGDLAGGDGAARGGGAERRGGERAAGGGERAAGGGAERRGGERAAGGGGRVRFVGLLAREEYRGLLRRARVFVTAPRREDYGIAQLEALVDGCVLVTTPAPGPYAALPLARALDPRLVSDELDIRAALDAPRADYAARAAAALEPWSPAAVDRVVAERVLPRLLAP
jgi:hypothetical protein